MSQPEMKDDDIFHAIGFTNKDFFSGTHMKLMQRLGIIPAQPPGAKLVEVYFLDAVSAPDPSAFKLYGDYLSVYFYSDTALALSEVYGIRLPPVIAKITRSELPLGAGISIRMPYPAGGGVARSATV